MHRYTKIILINELIFIVSSLIFFYLGVDRVLPIGFIIVVFGIGFFAIAQYFYMKKFLKELTVKTKKLFISTYYVLSLLVSSCRLLQSL